MSTPDLVSSEAMLISFLTVLLCNPPLWCIRTKSNRKWSSAMCKFWYIHSDIRGVLSTVVCIVTHHREEGRETFLYIKSTEILPVCLVDFCRIANFHRTYDHHPIQSKTILPNFPKSNERMSKFMATFFNYWANESKIFEFEKGKAAERIYNWLVGKILVNLLAFHKEKGDFQNDLR